MNRFLPIAALLGLMPMLGWANDINACKVAVAPFHAVSNIPIGANLRSEIERYRSNWRKQCNEPGRHSLADRWQELIPLLDKTNDFCIKPDGVDRSAVEYFQKIIPGFGFTETGEVSYPVPSITEFFKASKVGNTEDRVFFDNYTDIATDAGVMHWPWFTKTGHFSGCYRFGDYDWIGAFKKLERLKTGVKRPLYVERYSVSENELVGIFTIAPYRNSMCTCDSVDTVLADFDKVRAYFSATPVFRQHLADLDTVVKSLKAGEVSIVSGRENECTLE